MNTPDLYHSTTLSDLRLIADAVAAHAPELLSRTEKALGILLSGKVARIDGDAFEVVSADCEGSYRVDLAAHACDCKDFEHRAPEHRSRRWCKHLLACRFLVTLERRAPRTASRSARIATCRGHRARRLNREAA